MKTWPRELILLRKDERTKDFNAAQMLRSSGDASRKDIHSTRLRISALVSCLGPTEAGIES